MVAVQRFSRRPSASAATSLDPVAQYLEHIGRFEVECFTGQEHLSSWCPVGDPLAAPPVPEFGETATLDPGAEHDHGIGHTWIRRLDRLPGGFQRCDET